MIYGTLTQGMFECAFASGKERRGRGSLAADQGLDEY
jgi:hypothetical protein